MKITTFLLFSIIAIFLTNCSDGHDEKVLFKDTEKFITETSKGAISLVEIEVEDKTYETVVKDEILNYSFKGTITFNKNCYLLWNDGGKPVFIPVNVKPTHSESAKYTFHTIEDTVKYKGFTTYIKKKDGWELFSM